jgi:hypothetical protein
MMTHAKTTVLAGALLAAFAASAAPAHAAADPNAVTPQRAAALRECSTKASALTMQAWGSWPTYVYDNCMAQHGQKY